MMPRQCTICSHEKRDTIERSLVRGEPLRNISERHGFSLAAVHRHKENHLPRALVKAKRAEEVVLTDCLLDEIVDLKEDGKRILKEAEANGDLRIAPSAIRELRSTLELLAKLGGLLDKKPQHTTAMPIFVLPESPRRKSIVESFQDVDSTVVDVDDNPKVML